MTGRAPSGPLAVIDAVLGRVAIISNILGALIVLCLVVVVNADVVARGVFHDPFHGTVEVVQLSMVMIVFLQLPDIVRTGSMIRSDGVLMLARRRHPGVFAAVQRVIDGVSAVFMALIAFALWPEFLEALADGSYFGVPGVFAAPWWPVKAVICFSGAVCALLYALKALRGPRLADLRAPKEP